MNSMFEDFFEDAGLFAPDVFRHHGASGQVLPGFEVSEADDGIRVKAELPGMEQEDIDVLLDERMLTICGEKREEREDKDRKRNVYVSELSYGSFHRSIPLPDGINRDKVKATFKRGVLDLRLPRSEKSKSNRKRIAVTPE